VIEVSRYTLRSRGVLNARSERLEFPGALLRVDGGYGCLHPWPDLGDLPLEAQLAALRSGKPTAQTARSLVCCAADGAARKEGRNLFEGLPIPPSHFTAPGFWDEPVPAGFQMVKLKSLARLDALPEHLRLRLDFNGTSSREALIDLLPYRARVDFVEDPFPYDPRTWRDFPFPLASDRYGEVPEAAVRVIKPALNLPETAKRRVFTSYMDHPIGQLFAAWEAARHAAPGETHGLVTHHLFDDADPFIAAMGAPVPVLVQPPGTGLGFDELLANLPWSPL